MQDEFAPTYKEIEAANNRSKEVFSNKQREAYRKLFDQLIEIEKKVGFDLVDENIDRENCRDAGIIEGEYEFWPLMFQNLCMSAGMRAENEGHNINDLLKTVIY